MMTAAVMWLLSASIKAGLLLAASWLATAAFRRGTAAARHQLWALGLAGALLLPLLGWALPSLALPMETPTLRAGRALQATVVFVTGGPRPSAATTWPVWVVVAWAAGALLVSSRFLRAHAAARRLSRTAEPACAEAWRSARRDAAAALGMADDVSLGRSQAVASPMTIGIVRPRVLLPAAADAWSPERVRAVLIHELGHVRRRDTLVQLVAQLACILYWWNPLAWLAAARLRIERELACDDLVLCAGVRSSSYAADLLELARGRSKALAGAASIVDRTGTEARLRRILDSSTPRRPPGARFRLAARGMTFAFAVTLAGGSGSLPLPMPSIPAPLWLGSPFVDPEAYPPLALAAEAPPDMALVATEIESHLGDLRQCYERRRLVRSDLTGMVTVHWIISPTGRVAERRIAQDTLHDDEVLACVDALAGAAEFPAPAQRSRGRHDSALLRPAPRARRLLGRTVLLGRAVGRIGEVELVAVAESNRRPAQ